MENFPKNLQRKSALATGHPRSSAFIHVPSMASSKKTMFPQRTTIFLLKPKNIN